MRSLRGCQRRGTEGPEPEQFSNFEYFMTHNYGLVRENEQGWYWISASICMCADVCLSAFSIRCPTSCVSDYYTAIISGPSLLLCSSVLFLPSFFFLVKGSAPNKAHTHAGRMWGSADWFQLTPQLHTASPSLSLLSSFTLFPNTFSPKHLRSVFLLSK